MLYCLSRLSVCFVCFASCHSTSTSCDEVWIFSLSTCASLMQLCSLSLSVSGKFGIADWDGTAAADPWINPSTCTLNGSTVQCDCAPDDSWRSGWHPLPGGAGPTAHYPYSSIVSALPTTAYTRVLSLRTRKDAAPPFMFIWHILRDATHSFYDRLTLPLALTTLPVIYLPFDLSALRHSISLCLCLPPSAQAAHLFLSS